jgi:hypothetical protein
MFQFVAHSLQAFSLSYLEAFSHTISKMEYFRDREAVLSARRSRLAARVLSYGPPASTAPVVPTPPDLTQKLAEAELDCQRKAEVIEALLDMMSNINPTTTIPVAPLD